MFAPGKPLQPNLMFVSNQPSEAPLYAPLYSRFLATLAIIRLSLKRLVRSNTLAYQQHSQITAKKVSVERQKVDLTF